MKTIYTAVAYVQNELQDPRRVLFKRTKAELFCFTVFLFLSAELGLYYLLHNA